jgi:hypothetical protein
MNTLWCSKSLFFIFSSKVWEFTAYYLTISILCAFLCCNPWPEITDMIILLPYTLCISYGMQTVRDWKQNEMLPSECRVQALENFLGQLRQLLWSNDTNYASWYRLTNISMMSIYTGCIIFLIELQRAIVSELLCV